MWRGHWLDAPLGAPFPSAYREDAQRIQTKLGRGTRRENDFVFRHCEAKGRLRLSSTGYGDEAIQNLVTQKTGLLRFARNDEGAERVRGPIRDSEPSGNASSPQPFCRSTGRRAGPRRIRRLFKRFARSYVKEGIAEAFLPCR